jgi:AcrR family transcriptional regulator
MLSAMSETTIQTRREEYADATKAALLDAARQVFVEEGFQKAAVETNARRAVSPLSRQEGAF